MTVSIHAPLLALTSDLRKCSQIQFGVVVCRNTGLTDEAHIKFSAYFGELDDVKPYQKAGRLHRLAYPELFDAGNIDPETGDVAPLTAAQVVGNKVGTRFCT